MDYCLSREEIIITQMSRISGLTDIQDCIIDDISWVELLKKSQKNKTMFLVMKNLERCGFAEKIPVYLRVLIKDSFYCNEVRNTEKLEALAIVQKTMYDNGIDVVPVKGAYLIDNVYKDRSVRTTNDMDLLIRRCDSDKINHMMHDLNYVIGDYCNNKMEIIPFCRADRMLYKLKMYNLLPYLKIGTMRSINLLIFDFSFALDFSLDTKPVEEMLDCSTKDGFKRFLLPEHFFIHLCCHLYREANYIERIKNKNNLALIKFCDLREFVLKEMDKNSFTNAVVFAYRHGLVEAVYYCLYYLHVVYHDGYELEVLNKLDIQTPINLPRLIEKKYNIEQKQEEIFWRNLFSVSKSV